MMPEMDGPEVARRLRERLGTEAPRILVLSSAGQPIDLDDLADLGVDRVLTKPVKQSDLLDAIMRIFGAATREEDAAAAEVAPLPAEVSPMRLLLAEDGQVNQMVAIKLLEDRGHSVVLAANGRQALGALERERFDAVLMDVHMPEMDGFEATRAIREKEKTTGERLPIIAMTANAMKGDREECLEAGMDDYVAKPVRSRELFEAVEKFAAVPDAVADTVSAREQPAAPRSRRGQPGSDVFDPRDFEENVGGAELMRDLIDIFDEECDALLARIESASASGDAEALQEAAHALKGMVGSYGARQALNQARQLDSLARDGNVARARAELPRLRASIDQLRQALRDFRAHIPDEDAGNG
jgi:CheY-like chemotaxis protein